MNQQAQPHRHLIRRGLMTAWTLLIAVFGCASGARAEGEPGDALPITVPVQIRQPTESTSSRPAQPAADPQQPQPTQPTLPGGKLPQYQLGHHQRRLDAVADPADSRLRLLLALPSQPILLEVDVTIDGQPFRIARESRVAELLEAARSDEPATQEDESGNPSALGETGRTVASDLPTDEPEKPAERPAGSEAGTSDDIEPPQDESQSENDETTVNPPTVPPYSLATTAEQTVRRYLTTAESDVTIEEIRWLLSNWVDGPILLLLKENFQRFRADQRPVFEILDRDGDGIVSTDELKRAASSFQECDFNRDDIIDSLELAQAANDPRRRLAARPPQGTAIVPLPDPESATITYLQLAGCYSTDGASHESAGRSALVPRFDTNSDGRFDAAEIQMLQDRVPDLRLTLAFNTDTPGESTLTLVGIADDVLGPFEVETSRDGASISLLIHGASVTFAALQRAASDQISVGAVTDGYPLLPEIDPNDDGRFTIRELRDVNRQLLRFDRNQDGQITSDEVAAPIRVCFGMGPIVHQTLANIRNVPHAEQTPPVTGPDWFARMDRNKDNDLTRGEFPGTDEQFTALDADGDELISAREAIDYDTTSQPETDQTSRGEADSASESDQ